MLPFVYEPGVGDRPSEGVNKSVRRGAGGAETRQAFHPLWQVCGIQFNRDHLVYLRSRGPFQCQDILRCSKMSS